MIVVWLGGCGTPRQVRELSTLQIKTLSQTLITLETQSTVLISLAEAQAKRVNSAIDDEVNQLNSDMSQSIAEEIEDRGSVENAKTIIEEIIATRVKSEKKFIELRATVGRHVSTIRMNSMDIVNYQKKMIEAQRVLDRYIQSQKLGDRLTSGFASLPGVSEAIKTATDLIPRWQTSLGEIQTVVGELQSSSGVN